jgi:serine/threonine protein kinase
MRELDAPRAASEQAVYLDNAMSGQDHTINLGHSASDGQSIGALGRALAAGRSLADIDLDLSDPEQSRFGAYVLIDRIGAGGMGMVFRAHQHKPGTRCRDQDAQHAASPGTPMRWRGFRFEAKSAAALNHPNIVQILEVGEKSRASLIIAMQLVRGEHPRTTASRSERFAAMREAVAN